MFTRYLLCLGMDIINGAIDSLVTSTGKEEWTPVKLSIADTTVAVMKDKARDSLFSAQYEKIGGD